MNRPSRDSYLHPQGYIYVRVAPGKRRREHVLMAERAIGKPLPRGASVHHVNGDRADNRAGNLVVCQDTKYHKLLEMRMRALLACGNPDYVRCRFCGEYDEPKNLTVLCGRSRAAGLAQHRACHTEVERQRRQEKSA